MGFKRLIAMLMALGLSLGTFAQATDEELLQKADEARFIEADSFTFTLKVIAERVREQPDGSQTAVQEEALLKVFNKRFPEGVRIRVEFLEPESMRGIVYLIVGEDIYFWKPGLLQPLRISGQQKLFGDASVAEAAGIRFKDYTVSKREEVELDGRAAIRLELQAKSSSEAFQVVTLWLDQDTLKPVQALLAAVSGTPLKKVTYLEYASLQEDEYASQIAIEDLLFQGSRSTMHISEITIEPLSDNLFDPDLLGK